MIATVIQNRKKKRQNALRKYKRIPRIYFSRKKNAQSKKKETKRGYFQLAEEYIIGSNHMRQTVLEKFALQRCLQIAREFLKPSALVQHNTVRKWVKKKRETRQTWERIRLVVFGSRESLAAVFVITSILADVFERVFKVISSCWS